MSKKINISVLGTGHLGTIHSKLWKNCPKANLVGIYDVDSFKAEKLANELDCKCFSSIDEALNNSDAVTISTPTSLHYEHSIKCIEKGVHCFIEKPITDNYENAKEIIKLANEKNILVQVGHVERFNPGLSQLSKYEMNPLFVEAHRLSQFKPRAIDVSVILDLMIHDIDIVLWLVKSKVKNIQANGVAVLTDTIDIANARITFENNAVANLTASRISMRQMRKMRIFQKNAYFSIDFAEKELECYQLVDKDDNQQFGFEIGYNNKKIILEKPTITDSNAIAEEQLLFAESILEGKPVAVSAEDAANALHIAEEISKQVEASKVV